MAAGPAYPLKTIPGQHYVVDQNGVPFFIQGDSPWFLTEALSASNVDYYLSNKCALGYNAIILDIAAQPVDDQLNEVTNYYGQIPFTNAINGYTNLLSWNVNYFTNVDWVIRRAGFYGMCVFAYPLYDGYDGAGWYAQMAANPVTNLYQYGAFIGNRYKNFTNIVWIGAGDDNEPNAPGSCLWNNVAAGIASADTNHLITAQPARPNSSTYYSAFVNYQATYPTWYVYEQSLANYQVAPVLASFLREPYYENNTGHATGPTGAIVTALNCRQFGYWGVLSGDMGQFYGDENQWPFTAGWQTEMFDAASTTMRHLGQLFTNRLWYNFVPDANHTVVTSGYGSSGTVDYITTARESHGYTVISYFPQDQMTATVAMSNIAGATANAWWYNPSNGVATFIGNYPTTGTLTFTPASTNDWVLVLDDAAQNYSPPGSSNSASPEPLQITPSAGFISTGPFGGPFNVTNQNFALTNVGSTSLTWSLANTSLWLSASSNGGTLASGGAGAVVSISLNSSSTNLTVGHYASTVSFTNLSDNYVQNFQFMLTVTEAAPVLTWSNPAAISYGTALTSNQLNARANVSGNFAYDPSLGAVLDIGTNLLSVVFTPVDSVDYNTVTDSVSLLVSLAPVPLSVQITNNVVVLSWNDPQSVLVLQGATAVNGTFTNVPGARSPYSNILSEQQQFFRLVAH